jgi:hypothetical protein
LRALLRRFRGLTRATGADAMTDAQLLKRFVSSRDEAAFEVLVWRHGGMVHKVTRPRSPQACSRRGDHPGTDFCENSSRIRDRIGCAMHWSLVESLFGLPTEKIDGGC